MRSAQAVAVSTISPFFNGAAAAENRPMLDSSGDSPSAALWKTVENGR
jgi:hypothetical protein